MRDGIEYEFTTFFMLDYEHTANATKDRTHLFDGQYFTITPKTGAMFYTWLTSGAESAMQEAKTPIPEPHKAELLSNNAEVSVTMAQLDEAIRRACEGKTAEEKKQIGENIRAVAGTSNYKKVTDQQIIDKLYDMYK